MWDKHLGPLNRLKRNGENVAEQPYAEICFRPPYKSVYVFVEEEAVTDDVHHKPIVFTIAEAKILVDLLNKAFEAGAAAVRDGRIA